MKVTISPHAESDLDRILEGLKTVNPYAADRLYKRFRKSLDLLGEQPLAGRLRPDIAPAVRHVLVDPYVILYRVDDAEVLVVRVLHGRRNLPDFT